jgi:hypothetical protein
VAEEALTDAVDRRIALAREWNHLVAAVRELDGLKTFLQPPPISALLPAAEHGPVVIVNVSPWRCDALIVRYNGVTTCELPDLTAEEIEERVRRYLSVLQVAEAADLQQARSLQPTPRESIRDLARRQLAAGRALERAHHRVDVMLRELQEWMWDSFVQRILNKVGFTATPEGDVSTWPRMWWCPTGPLTVLPVHTAGYHHDMVGTGGPTHTVLDRVVSSYTPTLRALLRARRPDDRPSAAGKEFERLLFVDVPDVPGQVRIDNAAERSALFEAFAEDRRTVLGVNDATPDAVQAALADHRWVHFSCHGDQDLDDPTQGGLRLRDGMLTVNSIAAGLFHSDFAGLSACKTAFGGLALLDEAITLASALHYTGYRHVIAALWSVDNQASAEVFSFLYRTIAADGRLEPDRAPATLHEVVRQMRDREPGWPHRWTPFTHTGP